MAVNEVYKIMHDSIFHTLSPIKTIGPLGSTVNAPIAVCTNNNCLLYLFCRYQCISRCRSMGGLEPISRTTGAADLPGRRASAHVGHQLEFEYGAGVRGAIA